MNLPARAVGSAAAGLGVAAVWLAIGPATVQAMVAHVGAPAAGEAAFTLGVFGPLLVLALIGGWATGCRPLAPGMLPGRATVVGLMLGVGGLLLAAGDAALSGTVVRGADGGAGAWLPVGMVVVAFQVLAEEALFRGWLQPLLARAIGDWLAVGVGAVCFAALHLVGGWSGTLVTLNMFGGGLLFGLLAMRGGGIAGPLAAHWGWNGAEQLLLGLDPNPGMGAFGSVWNLDLVGAARWGGSEDGLNASWAMAMALVAVLAPLVLRRRIASPTLQG